MSKQTKKSIIEGWLKKKKKTEGYKLFGQFTKRWFALDIVNAILTYSSGKNKKANKVIPLRDILDLKSEVTEESTGKEPKEWEFDFIVVTKDRSYHLYANSKAEKEMWVHAFNTILKYKRKADETKQTSKSGNPKDMDRNVEDDGFQEEEEQEDEEDHNYDDSQPIRKKMNEGDYMEDDRRRVAKNNKQDERESESSSSSEEEEEQKEEIEEKKSAVASKKPTSKPSKYPESEGNQRSKAETNPPPQTKQKKEEKKLSKEDILRRQQEDDELRRQINMPLSMQKKRDPEVIEDEVSSSGEDEIKEKENQGYKTKEPTKPEKKIEKRKLDDMDDLEELDVDKYFKSGPKETIKLEPPSPPRESKQEVQPTYFTGFTSSEPKVHLQNITSNKPKPVVKVQKKNPTTEDGDLLGEWEKRYGRGKTATNEWGEKSNNEPIPIKKLATESKPKKVKEKQQYVENTQLNKPKAHGEDFEDNWDEEENANGFVREVDEQQSSIQNKSKLKETRANKEYRHPDIPEESSKVQESTKVGKKKKKAKKQQALNANGNDEFDLNWDDE